MRQKTVEVEAFPSPVEREQAFQQQIHRILEQLSAKPVVEQAGAALREVRDLTAHLKKAQAGLMKRAGEIVEDLRAQSEELEQDLIHGQLIDSRLDSLVRLEAAHRLVTQANKRLAEQRIPRAEIEEMERTAVSLLAQAAALRQEAEVRLEKTARLISEAAEFEGNIAFDPSQTISGALTARAQAMEAQADDYRRWAAERAERHQNLLRQVSL